MGKRIAIIQGHPSRETTHLGHALAGAYDAAAKSAGRDVREILVAHLDFPVLRTAEEWKGPLPESLREAQDAIAWADHLLIVFPLWTGTMPALLKAFFEQVIRPGFGFRPRPDGRGLAMGLTGKSARLVITMGMPAFWFRWGHGAYGVRGFQRGCLEFCGVGPVRTTYIGGVDTKSFAANAWLAKMRTLGSSGI
jgi:putative NADPH-quinone reductase